MLSDHLVRGSYAKRSSPDHRKLDLDINKLEIKLRFNFNSS